MASKFGAKKVYAIEPNRAIEVGIKSAKKNGFYDNIKFINKISQEVSLKDKVDLIIYDLRGVLPFYENNIETIIDARNRFLKKTGQIIPLSDEVFATVIQSNELYDDIVSAWERNIYNLNLSDGKNYCLNNFYRVKQEKFKILTESRIWSSIDYKKIKNPNFGGELDLRVVRSGTAHGIMIWFNSKLAEGIKMDNSPDVQGSKVYGRAFLPLLYPLIIEKGDRMKIDINANHSSGVYIWKWNTKLYKKFSRKPVNELKQSTFLSNPISPEYLKKRTHNYKTSINENAMVTLEVLNMFSKKKKLIEIAKSIRKKFPKKFKNLNECISYVGNLVEKYSE